MVDRFRCPEFSSVCTSSEIHESHRSRIGFARMFSRPELTCRAAMWALYAGSDMVYHLGENSALGLSVGVILARPDLDDQWRSALVKEVTTVAGRQSYTSTSRAAVNELYDRLLDAFTPLPKSVAVALSKAATLSPEGLMALLEQKTFTDDLAVALMLRMRATDFFVDLAPGFETGSDTVRTALALIDLRSWPDAQSLLKAARVTLSQFSRDRESGLETIKVLAKEWSGGIDDLAVVTRELL